MEYSPYMTSQQLAGLLELLKKTWWRRAWIIQEVIVARKVVMGCDRATGEEPAWFAWDVLLDTDGHYMRAMLNNHDGDLTDFT